MNETITTYEEKCLKKATILNMDEKNIGLLHISKLLANGIFKVHRVRDKLKGRDVLSSV